MSPFVQRVGAIGLGIAAVSALLAWGVGDLEQWQRVQARAASGDQTAAFYLDPDWANGPYSHLRTLGAEWTEEVVRVPSTGEVIRTKATIVGGIQVFAVRVETGL